MAAHIRRGSTRQIQLTTQAINSILLSEGAEDKHGPTREARLAYYRRLRAALTPGLPPTGCVLDSVAAISPALAVSVIHSCLILLPQIDPDARIAAAFLRAKGDSAGFPVFWKRFGRRIALRAFRRFGRGYSVRNSRECGSGRDPFVLAEGEAFLCCQRLVDDYNPVSCHQTVASYLESNFKTFFGKQLRRRIGEEARSGRMTEEASCNGLAFGGRVGARALIVEGDFSEVRNLISELPEKQQRLASAYLDAAARGQALEHGEISRRAGVSQSNAAKMKKKIFAYLNKVLEGKYRYWLEPYLCTQRGGEKINLAHGPRAPFVDPVVLYAVVILVERTFGKAAYLPVPEPLKRFARVASTSKACPLEGVNSSFPRCPHGVYDPHRDGKACSLCSREKVYVGCTKTA